MQFQPQEIVGHVHMDTVDIPFCEFMEPDPAAWSDSYHQVIEEYVTCMGAPELTLPGESKDKVMVLLGALGRKYNILQDVYHLVQARSAQDLQPPLDQLFPHGPCPKTTMAHLRKVALDALKRDQHPSYELKRALWLQTYERIKFIFESKVTKILPPPIFLSISQTPSRHNIAVPQIQDRTPEQLKHMYKDLYYVSHTPETGCQKYPFLPRWLGDDTKRTYLTCAFDPKGDLPCNYNTYVGMRAATLPPVTNAQAAQAGVDKLVLHIREVFCNNHAADTEFVLRWMANIVKYPWKKTEVLLLLFGVEGCGKSMVVDFFGNMVLGSHLSFQTASPGVDVFGKFAVGTHRKLLCFCDEGGEELTKYQDMLKNLITSKAIRVEKKGQDIRIEDNYTNVIVASNNAGPVRISSNDRRVVAFQCSDKYKDNYDYFASLAQSLGDDQCARYSPPLRTLSNKPSLFCFFPFFRRAFYDFLLAYDLDEDYSFQAHRPITAYYEALLASSLPLFWRFWSFKCLSQGLDAQLPVKTEQARYGAACLLGFRGLTRRGAGSSTRSLLPGKMSASTTQCTQRRALGGSSMSW